MQLIFLSGFKKIKNSFLGQKKKLIVFKNNSTTEINTLNKN